MMVLPGNQHVLMAPNTPPSTANILAFARKTLAPWPEERRALIQWAWFATGNSDDFEDSVRAWCQAANWHERTFYRRKERALIRVAAAKNRADRDLRTRDSNGP